MLLTTLPPKIEITDGCLVGHPIIRISLNVANSA